MKPVVRVAALQMQSTTDQQHNLSRAEQLLRQAVERGAELAVLPELFPCLGSYQQTAAVAEEVPGSLSKRLSQLAARHRVMLLAGSLCELHAESGKCFNTSLLFDPQGTLLARYAKIHLFDVDLPDGKCLRESDYFVSGDQVVVAETSLARCGLAICYDLRFPELFRQLSDQAAELILLPAAFTDTTGQAHWLPLLQARAIENQAFLIAANQAGEHSSNLTTYGHSLILDPWGEVLAEAGGTGEEVIMADLHSQRLHEVRERFPALKHRRL